MSQCVLITYFPTLNMIVLGEQYYSTMMDMVYQEKRRTSFPMHLESVTISPQVMPNLPTLPLSVSRHLCRVVVYLGCVFGGV
jgi:hypothetical protein